MAKLYIKNKYGITPNELLNNPTISLRAKGLYSYLQSKPDGWKFSKERIALQNKEGKDAVGRVLRELEEAGYLQRIPVKNSDGKFSGYDYILSEKPSAEKPSAEKPSAEKPSAEKGATYSNKDIVKKNIVKKNNNNRGNKSLVPDLISFFYEQTQEIVGIKPEIDGKKCAGLLNLRLKKYTPEQIKQLIVWYLHSKVGEKLGADLAICLSAPVINKWKQEEGITDI